MTVTIKAAVHNSILNEEVELNGVNWDEVTVKEINKRNGYKRIDIRYLPAGSKRATVFTNGIYEEMSIQDEETGRFLYRYNE